MKKIKQLPDAINASSTRKHSVLPTELIRTKELSAKAKVVLFILLSNSKGWKSHFTAILGMMKEGKATLQAALKELEESQYLIRTQLIDKKTKQLANSIWVYTDVAGYFDLNKIMFEVDKAGLSFTEKAVTRFSVNGFSVDGKTASKYRNTNVFLNKKEEVEDLSSTIIVRKNEIDLEPYKKIAWKLSKIIQTKKNIIHTPNQVKSWAEEIRKLHTVNKVDIVRQKQVLKWYKTAIGGEFIPAVESGKSFRDKFIKLESAMNRKQNIAQKLDNAYNSGTYEIKKKAIKL